MRPADVVHDAVAAGFERRMDELEEALLGDDAVQPGDRFVEWGIEVSQKQAAAAVTVMMPCCPPPEPSPLYHHR